MKDINEIRNWILAWLERELRVPAREIKCDENLLNYGMDSVNAIMLVGDLESQLGLRLPPTLMWDHPTVDSLAEVVTSTAVSIADGSQPIVASREAAAAVSRQEAEELLQNIDQLSEEQINQLLDRLARE